MLPTRRANPAPPRKLIKSIFEYMANRHHPVKPEAIGEPALVDASLTGSSTYARWRASTLGKITEELERHRVLDQMGPVAGKRVLDVGSGDGVLTTALATLGAFAVGLDVDRPALRVAAARRIEPPSSARYVEGRIERLPFRDATFDVVVAVTVLCLVADRPAAIREAARVLRPGGRLVVGELGRWNLWAAKRRVKAWLGSRLWRSVHFSSASDLVRVVQDAELAVDGVRGSVYYPPVAILAGPLARLDNWIGSLTTAGAAFIVVTATKVDATAQDPNADQRLRAAPPAS